LKRSQCDTQLLMCPGDTDLWKKPEVEISCQTPFKFVALGLLNLDFLAWPFGTSL
jgi:hypothetical protein